MRGSAILPLLQLWALAFAVPARADLADCDDAWAGVIRQEQMTSEQQGRALEFRRVAVRVARLATLLPERSQVCGVPVSAFKKIESLLSSPAVEIRSTMVPLFHCAAVAGDGVRLLQHVDGINSHFENLIAIRDLAWSASGAITRATFALHESLGLVGDRFDSGWNESSCVVNALRKERLLTYSDAGTVTLAVLRALAYATRDQTDPVKFEVLQDDLFVNPCRIGDLPAKDLVSNMTTLSGTDELILGTLLEERPGCILKVSEHLPVSLRSSKATINEVIQRLTEFLRAHCPPWELDPGGESASPNPAPGLRCGGIHLFRGVDLGVEGTVYAQ